MSYVHATEVHAPQAHWRLYKILIDRGEGKPVWCIGFWDQDRVIGFRWNGHEKRKLGNPISSTHPVWVIMDKPDYPALISVFPSELQAEARQFLNL